MITCRLRDKEYSVDYISGRALREIEPASRMLAAARRITDRVAAGEPLDEEDAKYSLSDAMDVLVRWFCVLFGGQFTPAEVYDNYPVDRLMSDVAVAVTAVQLQMTEALNEFPIPPAAQKTKKKAKA